MGLGVAVLLDRASPMVRRCYAYGTGGDVGAFALQHNHSGNQGGGEAKEHAGEDAPDMESVVIYYRISKFQQ